MTDVQMCICGAAFFFFLQGRKKRGGEDEEGVVMLIKAAHLQPIKEPLSFIKANLLKHAARDVKTGRLCRTLNPATPPPSRLAHSLFISLYVF